MANRTQTGSVRDLGLGPHVLSTGLTLFLSALVLAVFVYCPGLDHSPRIRFHEMIYGEAHKPFVTRALLPLAVRTAATLLPQHVHDECTKMASDQPTLAWVFEELGWDKDYALEFALALVCLAMALIGFRYALHSLLKAAYAGAPTLSAFAATLALAPLPMFFRYYSHIYDFPNLALFTFGLAMMLRRRWLTYLIVLLLAIVNKETSLLLILIFAVYFRRRPLARSRQYAWLIAIQVGLYVVIRSLLALHFAENPGTFLEFHLVDHNIPHLLPFSIADAVAWLVLVLVLGIKWPQKPLFARISVFALVPLCAMAFLFGYFDELRMYYEAYPAVCLLLFHSLATIWQVPFEVRQGPDGVAV